VALLAVAWMLAVAVLLVAAWHRVPWTDEGNFAQPSFHLAWNGKFATPTADPSAQGLLRADQRTYWILPLHSFLLAGWYRVFPTTIFWARVLTILMLPLLGWQTFRLARFLTGDTNVGLLAATLLPLDYVVLYTGSWARPDVMCAVLGLTAICAYLRWREENLRRAVLQAAFWVTLSALTHPNAVLHIAGLTLLVLWYDRKRLTIRLLLDIAGVGVLTASPYLVYIAQDFEAFRQQFLVNAVGNDRMASSINALTIVWRELSERYAFAYGLHSGGLLPRLKSVALVSYAAATGFFVLSPSGRRQAKVGLVALLCALYFCVQCVFNQKLSVYLIHILPLYAILVAAGTMWLWRNHRRAGVLAVVWLVTASALQTAGMFWVAKARSAVGGQREAALFLTRNAGRARQIDACVSMVFALHFDARLRDDQTLGVVTGVEPDVFVIDDFYREFFEIFGRTKPALMGRIRQRIAAYRLVYDRDGYQIYFNPNAPFFTTSSTRAGHGS